MTTIELPARNLKLVDISKIGVVDRPWLMVHAVRTLFLVCILMVSVVYQIRLGNFLNIEIWLPVYAVLLASFFLNSVYLFSFSKIKDQSYWNGVLFGLDGMAVTLLIYFTGTSQSLFLFLYLTNLLLGALVFSREGGWLLAIWTSICFSMLLIVSPDVSGQSLYFSLAVNNIAFVAVTFLGGRLSEQVSAVGAQLVETKGELAVLQNLNELIVSNIATGIVVVSRTGFVQYFNPQAAQILEASDFQQIKFADVLPELDWPWKDFVEDESQPYMRRGLLIKRSASGSKFLEVVAARLKEMDGKVKGWLFLLDDRTEQKAMEDSLQQQEKLAAVGQLAAGIAHEIRNPLASISGSIQLMLANPGNHREEDIKLMRIVDKEIDRLNRLITDFLNYVRPEGNVDSVVNVSQITREVLESVKFNPKLRQDVQVEAKLKAQCDIIGNRDKLKQAILNLVINSYQAMEKSTQAKLEVESFDRGDSVVLIVRDNGCGIKKENLNRIFEPFHTTKPQGTGLGLAVTYKILVAHRARIGVDSVEKEGTKFTIEFPAHRDLHTEDLIPIKRRAEG